MLNITIDSVLPFVLVFAVAYGGLLSASVLKDKRLNALVATVLAFFAITNSQIVAMLYAYMPYVAVAFMVFFVAGYVTKSLSGGEGKDTTQLMAGIALALVFAGGYIKAHNITQYNEALWLGGLIAVLSLIYAAYKKGDK